MTSHGAVNYAILGPLRIDGEDGIVELDAPKQRLLLALLLVRANRPVPVDTLYEALWPTDRPAQPRKALAWHVLRLRQRLGGKETIGWAADGYRLAATDDQIDAHRFTRLLREAARLLEEDPAAAERLLGEALALWRGPALAGLADTGPLREVADRLDELRLTALEHHGEAELALGRHTALLPVLRERVAANPFRERFLAQLMLALHRDGRRFEALRVFADGRARMADSLGLDPSPSLRELEQRIARDDVDLDPSGAVPVPRQLPADLVSFTGRDTEVEALTALPDPGDPTVNLVSVVDGMGGVGKTALAVHAAHRLAGRYPDGQLFIDLHGYSGDATSVPAAEALERLLRALGAESAAIPSELDQRSALLRSLLSGRRMLLLLDNAASERQVRPLLPGGGHRVIVTSRHPLPGLDEARPVSLGVLEPAAAIALFVRAAVLDPAATDDADVAAITELCGRLPLAVRIAAARLRGNPHWTPRLLRRRLADDSHRVAELRVGNRHLEATFRLSLRDLDERHQRAFRLLTAAGVLDFGPQSAAVIVGEPVADVEDLLADLVDARLLDNPAPDRFAFHDLVRLYGGRLSSREQIAEVAARLGDWYVDSARAAKARVARWAPLLERRAVHAEVSFPDYDAGLRWFDTEFRNLLLFLRLDPGRPEQLWLLVDAMDGYFHIRHAIADQREAITVGFDAAVRCGDRAAEASMRAQLGASLRRAADYGEALRHQHAALRLAREIGDRHREQFNLLEIASAHEFQGDTVTAIEYARLAYAHSVKHGTGNPIAALDILGCAHQMRGELRKAAAVDRLSVYRKRRIASISIQNTLGNLSMVYCDLGRLDDAREAVTEALRLAREHKAHNSVKSNLDNLARIEVAAGDHDAAVRTATEALRLCDELNTRGSRPYLLVTLAMAHLAHRPEESRRLGRRALTLARRLRSDTAETEALLVLAESQLVLRDPVGARQNATRARDLARDREYRVLAGKAATLLAEAALAVGDAEAARRLAREAADVQSGTGCRPDRDRALRCLAAAGEAAAPRSP